MTQRKPTTINLRDDHREWLDNHGYNRSELVNQLISEFRSGEYGKNQAVRKFRIKEKESEIRELETRLELKQEEMRELQESTPSQQQQKEDIWTDALQKIQPPEELAQLKTRPDPDEWQPDPTASGVEHYAEQLGITPEEFCERYQDKRDDLL